ncbi:conserved Plasmodium protein, unknown function [Plasmodium ovale curtisi]|uniref:Uncharacterized protein n=1 Tax=Plasmodium ovale curtisi TaxID=864141 RepID=A0A1A8WLH9_PLAOA|nr:conserved Plasmodium protein, unknown function [Plasmodium ovale curtisi]SBT02304.1 conserved Plasmodium protein, unknown function [Plasmodium ovale curtisi]
MLNSDLAKPEVDLTVCDYTDIPMHVSLITYEYIFDPWSNDSRYIYSHEQMQREIDELNALIKSKDFRIFHFLILILLYGYQHHGNVYISQISVIEAIETKVKELNNKYDCEQIHFKFINFSGLGFKYLKFLPKFKDKIYFTLRVVYRYCKII